MDPALCLPLYTFAQRIGFIMHVNSHQSAPVPTSAPAGTVLSLLQMREMLCSVNAAH